MGFKVPRRQANVTFEEGHDYHGAEVVLNLDLPIATLFELQRLRADDPEAAVRMFADEVIAAWNVEDDSGAVATDYEGAKTQPGAFITTLMNRWVEASTTAPAPLERASSDTGGSAEPLTPTGTS